MKAVCFIFIALQLSLGRVFAHDPGEHASTTGLLGLKAEYLHVLLNPLPEYGLALGAALLGVGLVGRNKSVRLAGLLMTGICAASAWPVLYYGQHAYNSLAPMLDTESEQWLDLHMQRAERFIFVFYTIAAFALGAAILPRRWPKSAFPLAGSTLLLALGGLGLGAWISRAGGQVSHSEFRQGDAPAGSAHSHEHSAANSQAAPEHPHSAIGKEPSESKTNTAPHAEPAHTHSPSSLEHTSKLPSPTASAAKGAATNAPSEHAGHEMPTKEPNPAPPASAEHPPHEAGKTNSAVATRSPEAGIPSDSLVGWLPDTPEAVWTQLHRHQAELQAAIEGKKFDGIHAHSEAVRKLTGLLVQLVHPDHKAVVEKGAEKINHTISATHASVHADDTLAVENNFKQFSEALQALEQQMKKQ